MRFILLSALLLAVFSPAMGQISGAVITKDTHLPLNHAGVVLTGKTGAKVIKTATDPSGRFIFNMPPSGEYKLTLSYLGFNAKTIPLKILTGEKRMVLDSIFLEMMPLDLAQVEVKANKSLTKIKGDTLEFRASDFYTAEKASVLNLFQKIPGLTVDIEGNFYFQGVAVRDLYIDGRPAFQNSESGIDPKTITRLLQASIVDKIQVTTKKEPVGLQNPSPQKVINITTKPEVRKRINGEIGAGYAPEDGYKAAANAARFADHSQLMALANFGNLSSYTPPSGADESMDMEMRSPGTTRDGKMALNSSFDAGKKAKINLSYTRLDRDADLQEQQQRENLLPQGSIFNNSNSQKQNRLRGNMLGTSFEYKFNEQTNFTFRGDLAQSNMQSSSTSVYSSQASATSDTLSYGHFSNTSKQKFKRGFINTEFTHQFPKKGVLRMNLNYDFTRNRSEQYNSSMDFKPAALPADTTNQQIRPLSSTNNLNFGANLYQPISTKFFLQLNYGLAYGHIQNDQLAYNYYTPTGKYEQIDSSLTYSFENISLSQTLTPSVNYHAGKFDVSVGATIGLNNFKSLGSSASFDIAQHYNYFSPAFAINWAMNPQATLRLDFSNSPLMPLMEQVLPVQSVQNPLVIQLGNPDLKLGYSRRLSVDYNLTGKTGFSFSIGGFATFEYNSVSTSVFTDSTGKQTIKPINVDGTRALSPTLNFGKRFQKARISISYRGFSDFRRSLSLINGEQNINHSIYLNQDFNVSWNYKTWLELSSVAQLNYRGNRYDLQNSFYHFSTTRLFLKAVFILPAGIQIGTAGMYTKNSGLPGSMLLWNGWVSKLLSKQKWLLKCYGFDLLNQSTSQMAVATPTMIDRTVSNSQRQYFMLSLTRFFK